MLHLLELTAVNENRCSITISSTSISLSETRGFEAPCTQGPSGDHSTKISEIPNKLGDRHSWMGEEVCEKYLFVMKDVLAEEVKPFQANCHVSGRISPFGRLSGFSAGGRVIMSIAEKSEEGVFQWRLASLRIPNPGNVNDRFQGDTERGK